MLVGLEQKLAETGEELVHEKLAARSAYRMLKKKTSVLTSLMSSLNPRGSLLAGSANTFFLTKILKKLQKKKRFISVSLYVFCLLGADQLETSTSPPFVPPSPSQGKPRAFELLKIVSFKFPPLRAKIVFKCRILSSDLSVKCPS